MSQEALGDRMKNNYERPARRVLTRRMPVIVRVDGRAFHTYTRGMERPFDLRMVQAMVKAATNTAGEMQGFKLGYVQSDEASFLLTDYDTFETQPWFGNVQNKIESITASLMTAYFNRAMETSRLATFDARAFSIPQEEIANYFLWRALDWERNSVQMYAQGHFSPKQLHGQGRADQHEMLHTKGLNWATDLSDQLRNGTFILRDGMASDVLPNYQAVAAILSRAVTSPEPILAEEAGSPV